MKTTETKHIDPSMFEFVQREDKLHDVKLDTKPIGYLRDAWRRFKKNKASVVAAVIILLILVFAIFVPIFSSYGMAFADVKYKNVRPKLFSNTGFWDGTYKTDGNYRFYEGYLSIGAAAEDKDGSGLNSTQKAGTDSEFAAVAFAEEQMIAGERRFDLRLDSYMKVGFQYMRVTEEEYQQLWELERTSGLKILYPMVDKTNIEDPAEQLDANVWYLKNEFGYAIDRNGEEIRNTGGNFIGNYLYDESGNVMYYSNRGQTSRECRILYYNYFTATHGKAPSFLFGTNDAGRDILVRLAGGARTSLLLAVCVSAINLLIGALWGSVAGYYGGKIDLFMERLTDILSGIPFIIVATLFQLHLVQTGKVSSLVALLFAFVLTGWIGTAATVRTQFYRFKRQEYVLAARTLGARDSRLMFKHIFPNSLGTLITSSVLVIPSVIFSESMLSYLGIISLVSDTYSSIGSMLSDGQAALSVFPHIILFPAIIISLLMICFNLFGNGLRDAFNPSLRGAEE